MNRVGPDTWAWAAAERRAVADLIESLPFDDTNAASACAGWRVRDVAGHLVWAAENTPTQIVRSMLRSGPTPNGMIANEAIRIGMLPTPDLVERLRRSAELRPRLVPAVSYLGDVLVHAQDMARPLGIEPAGDFGTLADLPGAALDAALRHFAGTHEYVFGRRLAKGLRLVASDIDIAIGDGPEVVGRAIDLLLVLADRADDAIDDLTGDGVARLSTTRLAAARGAGGSGGGQ